MTLRKGVLSEFLKWSHLVRRKFYRRMGWYTKKAFGYFSWEKQILLNVIIKGVAFGMVFPIVAYFMLNNPDLLFKVICLAPFVLGVFSYFVGAARLTSTELALHAKQIETVTKSLEEAQKLSKTGSWYFDSVTQEMSWSKQMYDLFFMSLDDEPLRDEALYSAIHKDDQALLKASFENCLQTGTPYKIRIRNAPGKTDLWMEAIGQAIRNEENQIFGIQGTFQDISAVVASETELANERSKSLQNAKLALLGELSAGIAHEINNPLAIIIGNIGLVKKYKDKNQKFEAKIDIISRSAARIEKIISGLRKFSRTTEGNTYRIESLDEVMNEVMILVGAKSKRYSTPILLNIAKDLKVYCDEVEMEQVLVNLINNGIDAVRSEEVRWVRINGFEDPMQIVLQVIDSGHGIPKDAELKLFNPFYTTKPVGEGTGLGLSISKGILDQHGASIHLNREFENTCFEIRFPKAVGVKDAA